MNIYVLRHAIAKDRAQWKQDDAKRPLTKDGVRKMKRVARGIKHLHLSVDQILTSPYKRALDTAEIVAQRLKAKKKLKVLPELASDGDPEKLMRQLAAEHLAKKDSVLLVGHEPYLSKLVSVLIGAPGPLALDFKKGGLCKLSCDHIKYGRCAQLEWFLPPKLLKKV
jgi:phosphohistidine phosphatase